MKLTQAQTDFYAQNGYLVVENLVSRENMARLRNDIDEVQRCGCERRYPFTRRDNANEIERIDCTDRHLFPARFRASNLARQFHRFGKRELFAGQPGHEAAAANFSAGFEPAIDAEKLAPGDRKWFAHQQSPAHDAVAL